MYNSRARRNRIADVFFSNFVGGLTVSRAQVLEKVIQLDTGWYLNVYNSPILNYTKTDVLKSVFHN